LTDFGLIRWSACEASTLVAGEGTSGEAKAHRPRPRGLPARMPAWPGAEIS